MKKLLLFLLAGYLTGNCWASRLVFDPREQVGVELSHEEHAGGETYKYKNLQWLSQKRVETTRIGITVQVPVLDRCLVMGRFGKVWNKEFSPETSSMSSYYYNGDGMYYNVSVLWRLGR